MITKMITKNQFVNRLWKTYLDFDFIVTHNFDANMFYNSLLELEEV